MTCSIGYAPADDPEIVVQVVLQDPKNGHYGSVLGGPVFKGSPTQVADEMEDWWRSKAGDGFTIMAPVQPSGLSDFVDLVVPELQRRGIFRKDYETTTLRGHLGLPDAPSQWHAGPDKAERGAA